MGSTKYDWTDKTKTGLSKEEYDALWVAVNAIGTTLGGLTDVVITSVADHELLAWDLGTSKWINMTPAEAGLDAIYFKLSGGTITGQTVVDASNILPLLVRNAGDVALRWDDETNYFQWLFSAPYFQLGYSGNQKARFDSSQDSWETLAPETEPSGTFALSATLYAKDTERELWALWKGTTGGQRHAMVARDLRTTVWLSAGAGVMPSGSGATHVLLAVVMSAVRFADAVNGDVAWTWGRPDDWDYGKIQLTLYWMNHSDAVTGNHYTFNSCKGCAVGEDLTGGTCNAIIGTGGVTIPGLNDASKIGSTTFVAASAQDLTGEDFFYYRLQRQGGHGSDTSTKNWEVIGVKAELLEN